MTAARRVAVLRGFVLAAALLAFGAGGEDCEVGILVHRNTVYDASAGESLRIECPVKFCNTTPPTISWYKLNNASVLITPSSHINTEWRPTGHLQGNSVLIFQNALVNDSGVYQCKSDLSASHIIKVSVNGEPSSVTQKTNTTNPTPPFEMADLYIYSAVGIVAFVVIVIIVSVASMRGCKGKSKNGTGADNQYTAIPMDDLRGRPQAPPRGSPSTPPSRSSSRRKAAPPELNQLPSRRHKGAKGDGRRQRKAEEEGNSIVYVVLDHQPLAGAAARPRQPKDEQSEYAAICVRG